MSIVLKENEWAASMIKEGSLGCKPFETLRRVARYYLDSGKKGAQVRRSLDQFLLRCEPTASLTKWSGLIDSALAKAKHSPSVDIDGIDITDTELSVINSIDGRQAQRLAFTLLCLAKYWCIVNPKSDGWVNNKDSEIMSMANIKAPIRRQSAIYRALNDIGLIQFSKRVDNTNVKVCFMSPGKTVISISDFRNLGYQFNNFVGEPGYMQCTVCGIITKRTGRQQKYCKQCAIKMQSVNAARYARERRSENIAS